MQWGKKQRTGLLHTHPFGRRSLSIKARKNQSQRKAKLKYGICAGFWLDRRGHKAKRSDARFIYIYIYIYIYIANDESPSQHVTVGLAEARPKNILSETGELGKKNYDENPVRIANKSYLRKLAYHPSLIPE